MTPVPTHRGELDGLTFQREALGPRRPLHVVGAAASWPCVTRWTDPDARPTTAGPLPADRPALRADLASPAFVPLIDRTAPALDPVVILGAALRDPAGTHDRVLVAVVGALTLLMAGPASAAHTVAVAPGDAVYLPSAWEASGDGPGELVWLAYRWPAPRTGGVLRWLAG